MAVVSGGVYTGVGVDSAQKLLLWQWVLGMLDWASVMGLGRQEASGPKGCPRSIAYIHSEMHRLALQRWRLFYFRLDSK